MDRLYLDDEDFIAYLKYLRGYWKTPEYAQYIIYPACLTFLDYVLDYPQFRALLKDSRVVEAIFHQQVYWWQYRNGMRL